ncbi:MAG: hypothetical protein OXI43_14300 [Candidatus Poribacteria bacterium]|nr:hypothetical protein [Candidatus Poribacteria bacterium]
MIPINAYNLLKFEVPRGDNSLIICYLRCDGTAEPRKKPIILLLQGSGANSFFSEKDGKYYTPLLFSALEHLIKDWHVIGIEKRGVQLGDFKDFHGYERASQEYIEHATLFGRVDDINRVIDYFQSADTLYDGNELVVIGHSEGSHVAAGVAATNRNVTHLVLLGFSAAHGLFDAFISLRRQLKSGKISGQEFIEKYNWFTSKYRDIRTNPQSLQEFYGHTYKRWASYCFDVSLQNLAAITLPIFLGIGSLDENAIGSDYFIADLVKRGKDNLTYKNYLDCDHGFFRHSGDKPESIHSEVVDDIMKWVKSTSKR